jgi:hypothetical protein
LGFLQKGATLKRGKWQQGLCTRASRALSNVRQVQQTMYSSIKGNASKAKRSKKNVDTKISKWFFFGFFRSTFFCVSHACPDRPRNRAGAQQNETFGKINIVIL